MSEVATAACDGCAEQRPVQQLEEVSLPEGGTVVCCPDCRYHAEKLASGTAACEGCGDERAKLDLEPAPMPDGRELDLCPDCLSEAAALHGVDAGADGTPGASDSGGSTTGSGTATASTGGASMPGDDSSDAGAGGAHADGDANADAAGGAKAAADGDAAGAGGLSGKPATTEHVCDQCGEFYSIELYKVQTVDGRSELFCPDCKEEGLREGVVTDVELRRSQAYEVLGLDGGAEDDEVRQAYLRRVKEVHPDRADGDRSEFMLVKQAYERLSDE